MAPWHPAERQGGREGGFHRRLVFTLFLVGIPLVGLILLLAWAFSGSTNSSKQNWARAALIWAVIAIVLAVVFGGAAAALMARELSRLA